MPRGPAETGEECAGCGSRLWAGPRGTWRVCLACRCTVVPAGVAAPYAAGDGGGRRVVGQRERDLAAIALARRKGVLLDQLAKLAADPRLHPEAGPVLDWLAGQVREAASDGRLDELAAVAADPAAGIRRRHWWQGDPAPLPGPAAPGDDGWGVADDDGWDDDEPGRDDDDGGGEPGVLAGVVVAGPVADWAAELAARDWALGPHGPGTCQVVRMRLPDGSEAEPPVECADRAARVIPGGVVCEACYQALTWRAGKG